MEPADKTSESHPTDHPAKPSQDPKIHALIDYEDPYVQLLILSALHKHLPTHAPLPTWSSLPTPSTPSLQIRQYESLDFSHLLSHPSTSLANAYIFRKALIRKHYLSATVTHWLAKHPNSPLGKHVKPSVEFEVDYAEFLDEALVEAWELRESWERGGEWWILKAGMGERGQGIRLFESEEQLTRIFEGWDPESEDEEEVDDEERGEEGGVGVGREDTDARSDADANDSNGIITSQLRHFVAQPYIHPPLLLPPPSFSSEKDTPLHKFHIRTYALAVGALRLYVYKPMLALFAPMPYAAPTSSSQSASSPDLGPHLTNTCLQDAAQRSASVMRFWDLPDKLPTQPYTPIPPPTTTSSNETQDGDKQDWKSLVFSQICSSSTALFEAAARGMSTHFQPLPNAFEVFGLDYLVGVEEDGELRAWLLEVNAFPDFAQTGEDLKGLVGGLWEGAVRVGVRPFFFGGEEVEEGDMVKVLDVDLGKR